MNNSRAAASSSRPVDQVILNPPYIYKWTADFVSGSARAGFYFFASAEGGTHHGNGYLVDQTANYLRIYEVANNTLTLRKQIPKPATNGNSYDYQATYDPATGWIYLWRDGVYLTGWQDSTPYTSGSYVALHTHNSNLKFDNIQFDWSWLTYIHHDHLGSNSVMTDETGQVVQEARYYPYGDWRVEPMEELTDVGFTGHQHNNFSGSSDLGLIYMRARYYLPGIGRFASADTLVPNPQNPQSFNRFSYVENSPLSYIDRTGQCPGTYNTETGLATEAQDCWGFLYNEFCSGGTSAICSDWLELLFPSSIQTCDGSLGGASCFLISFEGNFWTKDQTKNELKILRDAIIHAIEALNKAGFDGNAILGGITFQCPGFSQFPGYW